MKEVVILRIYGGQMTNMEALEVLGSGSNTAALVDPKTGRRLLACCKCDVLVWFDAGEGAVVSTLCQPCYEAERTCDFAESTHPYSR
jgi:hypothetical protein